MTAAVVSIFLLLVFSAPAIAGILNGESLEWATAGSNKGKRIDFGAAQTAFARGNVEQCLKELEITRNGFPQLPPAKIMLALMFAEAGQGANARAVLEPLALDFLDYPAFHDAFGKIALSEGRATDASLHFEKAIELTEGYKTWDAAQKTHFIRNCRMGLAAVAESRKDWPTVERLLTTIIQEHPKLPLVRQRLGRAYFHLGRISESNRELTQAFEQDKQLEPASILLARLSAESGNMEDAEKFLQAALKTHPNDVRVLLSLGNFLLDQGRVEESVWIAKRASDVDSTHKSVRALVGICARFQRRVADAEAIFHQLHVDDPSEFQWSNQLALSLADQADTEKQKRAIQLAEVNAKLFPQSVEALSTLGWAYYQSARPIEAEQVLSAAINAKQVRADTVFFLAHILVDQDKSSEAVKLLQAACSSTGRFVYREAAQRFLDRLTEDEEEETTEDTSPKRILNDPVGDKSVDGKPAATINSNANAPSPIEQSPR